MESNIAKTAKTYRYLGWNVVPLYNFNKAPQNIKIWKNNKWVTGWKELQTRQATDKEFEHWFSDPKVTGLGVITGKISGIVVVDEDSYKEGGKTFDKYTPLKTKTANGGRHHFFKYDEEVKNVGFKTGVYVEVQGDGKFIVLPPSKVYKKDGKTIGQYEWEEARIKSTDELPQLKHADIQGLVQQIRTKYDFHELVKAPLGTQHNNLRTIALKTFGQFNESDWDLASDIIRKLSQDFNPPHPKDRVEKLIRDCSSFIKSQPKDKRNVVAVSDPWDIDQAVEEREDDKFYEKQAASTGYADLDALVRGFIPGRLYTLTGDTSVGKTAIACNFANKVAEQGKRVLYIAFEPGVRVLDSLVSAQTGKNYDDVTKEDYGGISKNIKIYTRAHIKTLLQLRNFLAQQRQFDMVIVDHIGYFISDLKNPTQEQSNIVKEMAFMAQEQKVTILQIAHLRKRQKSSGKNYIPTADDISGTAAFKQDSTDVFIVVRLISDSDVYKLTYSDQGMLYVAKTKAGSTGAVHLYFVSGSARILGNEHLNQLPAEQRFIAQGFPDINTEQA